MLRRLRVGLAALLAAGLAVATMSALAPSTTASAASISDWDPGYIISDALFYNSSVMTASDIQNFLNAQVPTCRGSSMPCLKNYSQATSNRVADRYCNGYTGQSSETAAQIIDNVARSCGISQKVLLVLLQKEQGLVTSTSPSPGAYSAATGQSCPDTAPCDPAVAGFFFQVYYAARQFEIYRLNPTIFNYQAGRTNSIQYNPNAGCGTQQVYIKNQATAGLYIYTPYVPNQAALNNLYGLGDGCSTYGNRNFWRIYTDWFGTPNGYSVTGEYAAAWAALGGSSGILGSPDNDLQCVNNQYCEQTFTGGALFWVPGRGVFGVPNQVMNIWQNLGFTGGTVGLPTGVVVCASDGTCVQSFGGGVISVDANGGSLVGSHVAANWLANGGVALGGARGPEVCSDSTHCAQLFARGAVFSGIAATAVTGSLFTAWTANGSSAGSYGFPLSDAVCTASGCQQAFVGGVMVSSSAGSGAIPQPIASKYVALGGVSTVGLPVTSANCDSSGSCNQQFGAVRIDSSSSGAVIASSGVFLAAWAATGYEAGRLGAPTAAMQCVPATCYQSFAGGVLSGSPSGSIVAVYGAYRDSWLASGGPSGTLGLPLAAEVCNGHDCVQSFQNGAIDWSAATGAVTIPAWFLGPWRAQGGGLGRLGSPVSAMVCVPATCSQAFAGGVLSGSPSGSIIPVYSAYRDSWLVSGGPSGTLGLPVAGESCNGHDCSQQFQGGVIDWSAATGAVPVVGWFLGPWRAQGAGQGRLGSPVSAMVCVPATCSQAFAGGVLSGSPSGSIIAVYGAYRDSWLASGGPSGSLGLPVAGEVCTAAWCDTQFQHGEITWSPATGAVAVIDPVLSRWLAAGGASGTYGLPVAAASSSGGVVSQQFQHGTITG